MRRQFGRLDQRAIARRQRRDQRAERQLDGIVPRRHDPDNAERLRDEAVAARQKRQIGRDAARPHPAPKMAVGEFDRAARHLQLGDPRLLRGAAAKIGVDGGDERLLVVVDQPQQPGEPLAPHRQRWIAIGGESLALGKEARGKVRHGRRNRVHFFPPCTCANWLAIIEATTRAVASTSSGSSNSISTAA